MIAVVAFCMLCMLLFIGKILRIAIPFFQKLYLPSSVIGGVVGLIAFTCLDAHIPTIIKDAMYDLPGFLINVVFATLFLGATAPSLGKVFKIALPQLCIGQLLSWGQYVVGIGVTGLLLTPLFGIPPMFGNLLEIGFEGGHGTVGGLIETFRFYEWSAGADLGFTIATAGMIIGIVLGMMLVNLALSRNWITGVRRFKDRDRIERLGLYHEDARPSAGEQTVQCDSVDSLAWHITQIGLAIFIGYLILVGLQKCEILLFPHSKIRIFSGFPLFPLSMLGGLVIQRIMGKFKVSYLINHDQMLRISGASLDFLVVAAMTTVKLSVVCENAIPLLVIVTLGTLWTVGVVLLIAPKVFKTYWFERAIAEFGQATGVTATGLMLLRTADPEMKTDAHTSFGCKQLLQEPIMSGGVTATALALVCVYGWRPVWFFCLFMLVAWLVVAFFIARDNRRSNEIETKD
ncbi:MAG: hypothetical protein MJ025_02430 [Victivallaceae bacterium]|nr:hypothetical protein [Victivallaceae bacterium]